MATQRKLDAQKQCKCRNTNCLNLYCGCFAADVFCTKACTCKECFNRLRYVKEVEKAREQALLRNPLAFSTNLEKGCNCRKSTCTQEHCHCYKAKVGCQGQCRCVGCKNPHGERGDNSGVHHDETVTSKA